MTPARAALEDWLNTVLDGYDDLCEITGTDRAADASYLSHALVETPEGRALGLRLASGVSP